MGVNDSCSRCSWFKARGINPWKPPFPAIFNDIDLAMKEAVTVEVLRELGMRAAEVIKARKVRSAPFETEHGVGIISGTPDTLVRLDDGGLVVVDFKTTDPTDKQIWRHQAQLSAYALALEIPDKANPVAVAQLALVIFTPQSGAVRPVTSGELEGQQRFSLHGPLTLKYIPYDRERIIKTVNGVVARLASDEMPDAGRFCEVCAREAEVRIMMASQAKAGAA